MNFLFYRRIRGPIFLLTFGLTAALAQWHILSFGRSWPLYLIVYGLLRLAEGAALAASGAPPLYPTPGFPPQAYGRAYPPPAPAPGTGLSTIGSAYVEPASGYKPVPEKES